MDENSKRWMRIVVNGNAAAGPLLRPAVSQIRERGHRVEVRVTWEAGDAARYAAEVGSGKRDKSNIGFSPSRINSC